MHTLLLAPHLRSAVRGAAEVTRRGAAIGLRRGLAARTRGDQRGLAQLVDAADGAALDAAAAGYVARAVCAHLAVARLSCEKNCAAVVEITAPLGQRGGVTAVYASMVVVGSLRHTHQLRGTVQHLCIAHHSAAPVTNVLLLTVTYRRTAAGTLLADGMQGGWMRACHV